MSNPSSSLDDSTALWAHPDDESEVFTVGDMLRADSIEALVVEFLSNIEDGKDADLAMEEFSSKCADLGIESSPCPECGRYSQHTHFVG